MNKLRKHFVLYYIFTLVVISSCRKNDVTCLLCREAIIRYSYVLSPDTISVDYSLSASYRFILVDSSYIMRGYTLTIDTLIIPTLTFRECFATDQYEESGRFSSYFYSSNCLKQ